ncbi:MAG: 16S rRNA (cytidine(1402)-2'-O)-methyltransferase [Bacteroidales bacterium]|nr:16S rRNA (cytidine(1402)-2'-O)-methyltransferase [Bacteroidales bacterium]
MAKLYIIPTPIGNLNDITLRAIEVLKKVDFVIAEDTRKTSFLLRHFQIKKNLISYHKFNEHAIQESIINKLNEGFIAALVSDAGTPGISDPGFLIIRECIKNKIEVETLPGPTAFLPALINSGIPCDRFVFEGFLPHKKGRKKRLDELSEETRTMVFYESPHRIIKTLEQFIEIFGKERQASVSKEITKIYESNFRGTLGKILNQLIESNLKGEFVIVIQGII